MTPANSLLIKASAELLHLGSKVDAVKDDIKSLADLNVPIDSRLLQIAFDTYFELDEKWKALGADFIKLQKLAEKTSQ